MAYVSKWPITLNTGPLETETSRERGCLNVILPTHRCVNYLKINCVSRWCWQCQILSTLDDLGMGLD